MARLNRLHGDQRLSPDGNTAHDGLPQIAAEAVGDILAVGVLEEASVNAVHDKEELFRHASFTEQNLVLFDRADFRQCNQRAKKRNLSLSKDACQYIFRYHRMNLLFPF